MSKSIGMSRESSRSISAVGVLGAAVIERSNRRSIREAVLYSRGAICNRQ